MTIIRYVATMLGIAAVIAVPAAYVQLFAEPTPTKEENLRDCPRLGHGLYQRYRLSGDPEERMNVVIQLSGPE